MILFFLQSEVPVWALVKSPAGVFFSSSCDHLLHNPSSQRDELKRTEVPKPNSSNLKRSFKKTNYAQFSSFDSIFAIQMPLCANKKRLPGRPRSSICAQSHSFFLVQAKENWEREYCGKSDIFSPHPLESLQKMFTVCFSARKCERWLSALSHGGQATVFTADRNAPGRMDIEQSFYV